MVTAGLLPRRPAGMENRGAFVWRQTGHFQFLERHRRYGRDLCPMSDLSGCEPADLANLAIGGVVLDLERKKFERKLVKIPEGRVPRAHVLDFKTRASWNSALRMNGFAQTRSEVGKFLVHAVFVYGWFSATAGDIVTGKCPAASAIAV